MVFKAFVDANVILDYAFSEREGHLDALLFFQAMLQKEFYACTTPAIIHIVSYHMQKQQSADWARSFWKFMLDHVEIIELNHHHAVQAIHAHIADLEDALQYHAGLQHRCTHFISSDKALKKAASTLLPVMTAKQFLQSRK